MGPISKPLAGKKLTKKLYKLVKKASGAKYVKRGVKEVVKGLKKGDKGLCLIAGDIYPIDVISHLPVMCEERDTPYIYVPSKHDLGTWVPRGVVCLLLRRGCDGDGWTDGWMGDKQSKALPQLDSRPSSDLPLSTRQARRRR